MAYRFEEIESPAHGPFGNAELKKVCEIARYLRNGLSLEDVAKIYGEKASSIRAFYAFGLDQPLFRSSSAANDEKSRLAGMDLVRSTAGIPGGVLTAPGGVRVSVATGAPVREQFTRLEAAGVAKTLRAAGGNVKATARELQVDADDLTGWLERNAEMMAVLK